MDVPIRRKKKRYRFRWRQKFRVQVVPIALFKIKFDQLFSIMRGEAYQALQLTSLHCVTFSISYS